MNKVPQHLLVDPQSEHFQYTLPQVRKRMDVYLNTITGKKNVHIVENLRWLVVETIRRSPVSKKAKTQHPELTDKMRREIIGLKSINPNMSHRDISIKLDTSTRVVSHALAGKRGAA